MTVQSKPTVPVWVCASRGSRSLKTGERRLSPGRSSKWPPSRRPRGRITPVFGLGLLGAPLVGALISGWFVEHCGALAGLVPGMATSVLAA